MTPECTCDWCVPATAIAKRHADSTRRVRAEERTDAIAKSVGIDLTKARQGKREEAARVAYTNSSHRDQDTLDLLAQAGVTSGGGAIGKAAPGLAPTGAMHDPTWDRLLELRARAAMGDETAAMASAAIRGYQPDVYNLLPEVAAIRNEGAAGATKPKANKRRRPASDEDDGQTFDEFMASLGRGGSLGKSAGPSRPPAPARAHAGSQPTPRSLAALDSDPDFIAFKAQHERRF